MKTVLNSVLVVAIIAMGWLCIKSVKKPIDFQDARDARQAACIKKLIEIRKAEESFKDKYNHYTASFDSLINFLKTEQKYVVEQKGTISDYQLSKGLNEAIAWKMVRTHNGADAAKYGIDDFDAFCASFSRDTVLVSMMEATYGKDAANVGIDTLAHVPYCAQGVNFELRSGMYYNTKSALNIPVFEARVSNNVYLNGLDRQEVINMNQELETIKQATEDSSKYAGLRVGLVPRQDNYDVNPAIIYNESPNNNAGNWE